MTGQAPAPHQESVVYKASVPLALRGLGYAAALLGVALVLVVLATAVLDGTGRTLLLIAAGVLALPAVGGTLTGLARIGGFGARLEVSPAGFRNRTGLIGIGARSAAWTQVSRLSAHGDVLAIELGERGSSLVDAKVLGYSPSALGEQLRPHVGRPLT